MKVLTFPGPDPGPRPPNFCSAVLAIEENGEPVVLNLPTGDNIFWKQRAVLKHLGLYIG